MRKKKNFFTTIVGSWVKVFLAEMFAGFLILGPKLFTMDKDMFFKILYAAVAAVLPLTINYLNPKYPLYGRKPKDSKVVDIKTNKEIK